MNKRIIFIFSIISLSYSYNSFCQIVEQPKISFSFDDRSIKDMPNHTLEEWNQLLLDQLKKHNVHAILFAQGSGFRVKQ
jgi:hypothetical protein